MVRYKTKSMDPGILYLQNGNYLGSLRLSTNISIAPSPSFSRKLCHTHSTDISSHVTLSNYFEALAVVKLLAYVTMNTTMSALTRQYELLVWNSTYH
jgi:hypothetical protein